MSVKRDDRDAGLVDFSEVATGKRLPLIHPGEILRDDFPQPMKISVAGASRSGGGRSEAAPADRA